MILPIAIILSLLAGGVAGHIITREKMERRKITILDVNAYPASEVIPPDLKGEQQ